jgi:hypothetical protein
MLASMLRVSDEAAFSVDGVVSPWADVRNAAERWGEWPGLVERSRRSRARLLRAEEGEDPIPEAVLERAEVEFRYARNLETGEGMEAWLSRWRLDANEWTDALHAGLLEVVWPEVEPQTEEDEGLLHAELVSRGDAERLAKRLAERLAVAAAEGSPTDLASLDAAFAAFRARVATPEAVAERLRARRVEWTRIDGRLVRYRRPEAAKEAALATREDGASLDDVSAISHTIVEELHAYAEELDESVRERILGAQVGETLGPLRWGQEHAVVSIESKTSPSADDPAVAARAEESLLSQALERLVIDHVKWLFG